MKKTLLFKTFPVIIGMLACFVFTGTVQAQNSIPNGNFETWDSTSFALPQYFPYSANTGNFFAGLADTGVKRVTTAYHGNYAIKLTTLATDGDTSGAYFLNTDPNNGNPTSWTGGVPYNQVPTGISGYYENNMVTGDSGLIIVAFRKAGADIGTYFFTLGGVHASYTLFNFTFSPPINGTPDSVIFGATSSDLLASIQMAGSTMTLDDISFTGAASQPADFNGDFEDAWVTYVLRKPGSWVYEGDQNGDGMQRTTDKHSGNYAMELTTYANGGKNGNGQSQVNSGTIGTGSYPQNCNGFCPELGGFPFANQVDTLTFFYKYAPQAQDSAIIELYFKKNGVQIGNGSNVIWLTSTSGSPYQYMQFPFDVGQTPDTVIINIQSSGYNDTTLASAGSDLKIDDIYFKSQLNTGVKEISNNYNLVLYPNPFATFVTLQLDPKMDLHGVRLRIYDVLGRTAKMIAVTESTTTIQKDNMSPGIYFFELVNDSEILKTGKLVVE